MYGDRLFRRTPKGDDALAGGGLQAFSHRVHMVLKLCDGTHRYDFLEANLRRVDTLADIVRHLLENGLIEEVREAERGRGPLGRGFFAERTRARADEGIAAGDAVRRREDAEVREADAQPEPADDARRYFRAISAMSEALTEVFSDEVLQWSMDAEVCDDARSFAELVECFEALYAEQAGRRKASAFVRDLRERFIDRKVA